MEINRRHMLVGSGAIGTWTFGTSLIGFSSRVKSRAWPSKLPLFAAVGKNGQGDYSVVIFDVDRGALKNVSLPGRGHDIAVRPGGGECVVFARRPGTFAIAFDARRQSKSTIFHARSDRHFYGHGVFSSDGRYLFTSENNFAAGHGVIGVRDAEDGYRQIGEFLSGGVGPHDLALLSDGHTLVVANGGIETHPDSGRTPLNPGTMSPSLCYIDVRSGKLLSRHYLAPELNQLSIRHLTIGAGDRIIFGCQNKGQKMLTPDLIGSHRLGEDIELIKLPRDVTRSMANYVASIEADTLGEIVVATAPRGGVAIAVDIARRRYIGTRSLGDVSGVAPGETGERFVLTSGNGEIADFSEDGSNEARVNGASIGQFWDNHLVRLK